MTIKRARGDAATARRLLFWFTGFHRTPATVDRWRRHLIDDLGIPEALLPDAREFDRQDLPAGPG